MIAWACERSGGGKISRSRSDLFLLLPLCDLPPPLLFPLRDLRPRSVHRSAPAHLIFGPFISVFRSETGDVTVRDFQLKIRSDAQTGRFSVM